VGIVAGIDDRHCNRRSDRGGLLVSAKENTQSLGLGVFPRD